jgi:flavin-dependent dehydrogenase
MTKHDVIIIGGGPGGSTLAAYLAKAGVNVGIFEREIFPRFHIGESLLPASMPIFKETGFYEKLKAGKYIEKFGARFIDYRSEDEVYFGFQDGFNSDIPSAFEVERAEFDKDILAHAANCGATVYQPERVKDVQLLEHSVIVKTNKSEYEAKFLVDATGREAMMGKKTGERVLNQDLNNVAVFAHYTGVARYAAQSEGDITVALLPERSWSWVIPFKGERTSVGVVCSSEVFKGGADLSAYLDRMIATSSRLKNIMKDADRCSEVSVVSNYSHRSSQYGGNRWMSIGDAATFLDPIFSSGVHVSVTSARLASKIVLRALQENLHLTEHEMLTDYKKELDKGVARFHNLISMFYGSNFVEQMKKTLTLTRARQSFTSAVAGDMWNDANFLFEKEVL